MNERPPFCSPSLCVVIIGSGLVGSTYGYALLLHDIADEICLIDLNRDKAVGQAMDLNHAMPLLKRTEIWAGDMDAFGTPT